MGKVSATYLRQHIYELLDKVLATGKPLVVERNGRQLQVVALSSGAPTKRRVAEWVERDDILVGDFDDIVHIDWSQGWRP
jgi:hypothetical protein